MEAHNCDESVRGGWHHACCEVRTGETTSPARLRSKWLSVVVTNASASSSLMKRSNVTTHGPSGGRECTCGRNSGRATAASNIALMLPASAFAARLRVPAQFGSTHPHVSHDLAHCNRMKPAFAEHSPASAHSPHAECSSAHGFSGCE